MTLVRNRVSVWEKLVEPDAETTAPALRADVERVDMVSARDLPYTMLRVPGEGRRDPDRYLKVSREDATLADLMDGARTVAQLIAEFARISGRLAPGQVRRVIADLDAAGMLRPASGPAGLRPTGPGSAVGYDGTTRRLPATTARPGGLPLGPGRPLAAALHRAGGRWLLTTPGATFVALIMVTGMTIFSWNWWQGSQSIFLVGGSYAVGAVVLFALHLVASAGHAVGQAVAARHVRRQVGQVRLRLFCGIPVVRVDTSDVCMARRRSRLLVAVSGPLAALTLAGLAQSGALLLPAAAGWADKLAFVCYLGVVISLNPLLPGDGERILTEWLELPDVRIRALAWLGSRLGGRSALPRPPRATAPPSADAGPADATRADPRQPARHEQRLVRLYAAVAALWLAITAALAWRLWTDRVSGVVTALWPAGWADRLLLAAIIAALAAPALYALFKALPRTLRRRRRTGGIGVVGGVQTDAGRKLAVLRASRLGKLPPATLTELAAQAVWVRPRYGEPAAYADTTGSVVLVVADGEVRARRPGDLPGTARYRRGPGALIGLAAALTGRGESVTWYASGATLLAVPAPEVAAAVGWLPVPSQEQRIEAEDLFAETPALIDVPAEDRLALALLAQPRDIAAEQPIFLPGRNRAVVIGSGSIVLPEGTVLHRGTMIGPVDADLSDPVAFSRTPVRVWTLPQATDLPALLADAPTGRAGGAGAATIGTGAAWGGSLGPTNGGGQDPKAAADLVAALDSGAVVTTRLPTGSPSLAGAGWPTPHWAPPAALAWPPGPPPPGADDLADRRFTRQLRSIAGVLAIAAAPVAASLALPGPAWAEMPAGQVLLSSEGGPVTVITADGSADGLGADARRYLAAGDRVDVGDGGQARLTFRGGATAVVCQGSRVDVRRLDADASTGRTARPIAHVDLTNGRLLATTATPSRAYRPLAMTIDSQGHTVVNDGPAWFWVSVGDVGVAAGQVRRDGAMQPLRPTVLSCGNGIDIPQPPDTSDPPPEAQRPLGDGVAPEPSATPNPAAPAPIPQVPAAQPAPQAGSTSAPVTSAPGGRGLLPRTSAEPAPPQGPPSPPPSETTPPPPPQTEEPPATEEPPPPSEPPPPEDPPPPEEPPLEEPPPLVDPPPGAEEPPPPAEPPPSEDPVPPPVDPTTAVNPAPAISVASDTGAIQQTRANGAACGDGTTSTTVRVSVDDDGGADNVTVDLFWTGFDTGRQVLSGGTVRDATLGPYPADSGNSGGVITVWAEAHDGTAMMASHRIGVLVAGCTAPVRPY